MAKKNNILLINQGMKYIFLKIKIYVYPNVTDILPAQNLICDKIFQIANENIIFFLGGGFCVTVL